MTFPFFLNGYTITLARNHSDLISCQGLRYRCFLGGGEGRDADPFDGWFQHLMIVDRERLLATARLRVVENSAELAQGYTAQSYDLSPISGLSGKTLELGRVAICPDSNVAEVQRVLWAALTAIVEQSQVSRLIGCASLSGTTPAAAAGVFAYLYAHALGPSDLRPRAIAAQKIHFADFKESTPARVIPRLLKSYLTLGAWFGEEAVIDHSLKTMHVFTCLDVARVPLPRATSLRTLAQMAVLP